MANDPKFWRCREHKAKPRPGTPGQKQNLICGLGCRCHSGDLGEYACMFEPIPEEDFVDPGAPAYEDPPPEARLPMEDLKALESLFHYMTGYCSGRARMGEPEAWEHMARRVDVGLEILSRLKGGRDE